MTADLVAASLMITIGLLGLSVRPLFASAVLYMIGGLGVLLLVDLLVLRAPIMADWDHEVLLDWRFLLAWALVFVLFQIWLRRTASGRATDLAFGRFWDRLERVAPVSRDESCAELEERQFDHSLEAAGRWAEEKDRRQLEELFGEDDPAADDVAGSEGAR